MCAGSCSALKGGRWRSGAWAGCARDCCARRRQHEEKSWGAGEGTEGTCALLPAPLPPLGRQWGRAPAPVLLQEDGQIGVRSLPCPYSSTNSGSGRSCREQGSCCTRSSRTQLYSAALRRAVRSGAEGPRWAERSGSASCWGWEFRHV